MTQPTRETPALRDQIRSAVEPILDAHPEHNRTDEHEELLSEITTAVLGVVLPHGKFLGDMHREAEERLTETRAVLHEVLSHFVHKGHPGEPCLQTGWIRVRTVDHWRATLSPPAHGGPSIAEATVDDRRYWADKYAGEAP